MFFLFSDYLGCNYFGLRVYALRSIRPRFVLFLFLYRSLKWQERGKYVLTLNRTGCFNKLYSKRVDGVGAWGGGGGGGTLRNSWWGCVARTSKCWPYFRPKNVIFHTRFQTWPAKIHTRFQISLRNSWGRLLASLLRLERHQKNFLKAISNSRISLSFLSSFGIEMINTFIRSRSFLENHTQFQTKTGKVYTRFSYGLW